MRVAPIWFAAMGEEWATKARKTKRDLTALPIFRANLTSQLMDTNLRGEIIISAANAARDAADIAYINSSAVSSAAHASAAHGAFFEFATAVAFASDSATLAAVESGYSAGAVRAAARAAYDDLWSMTSNDAIAIRYGLDPLTVPLWSSTPDWFMSAWSDSKAVFEAQGGEKAWGFWINWYNAALNGTPQDMDLLRDVALIEEGVWKAGPEAVALAIEMIQERHRLLAEARILREALTLRIEDRATLGRHTHNGPPDAAEEIAALRQELVLLRQRVTDLEEALKEPEVEPEKLRTLAERLAATWDKMSVTARTLVAGACFYVVAGMLQNGVANDLYNGLKNADIPAYISRVLDFSNKAAKPRAPIQIFPPQP